MNIPLFARCPGAFCGIKTWGTGMNESRAISFVVYPLKVNYKLIRIMLSIGKNFSAEERDDMIRNDLWGFVLEVGIIYTEVRVEPVDLVGDELSRYEALLKDKNHEIIIKAPVDRTFPATSARTFARCSSCGPSEKGCCLSKRMFLPFL